MKLHPNGFKVRPTIDNGVPLQNVYNRTWLPKEAIRRREAKIEELKECKDVPIASKAYGRQRRLDSPHDLAERDRVVPNTPNENQDVDFKDGCPSENLP